ncbi:MAG: isoprenyl transferase [Capnocytophaga sp.]|nr:isoprenyl transferase [Capnocytophaga sp.]
MTNTLDKTKLPQHLAIIMDGNGRWAKQQGKLRVFGHEKGTKVVREIIEAVAEIGIPYLTLYAFSMENWKRPILEVEALMRLLVNGLKKEVAIMHQNNIRLNAIGNLQSLPKSVQKELQKAMETTKNNTRTTVTLALGYSGQEEITHAVAQIAKEVKENTIHLEDINISLVKKYLYTKDIPEVDLLIRTSGEYRISNFLLWQIAYAELYFTEVLWPDFSKEELQKALLDYQNRERRFGKTSEQIS